jgi:hypothetical protein
MAWIEVHQALFTHRKVMHLADQLGIPEVYACAHLISLWTWALDNAPDGALNVRCTIVARASRWMGDADALVHALCETGFLDEDEDGIYYIHDWDDYAGRLVEKRRQNRDRMREARSKPAKSGGNSGATHVQRTLSARAGATVPNPTQPTPTEPKRVTAQAPALKPDPSLLFETFWDLYPARKGHKAGPKGKVLEAFAKAPAEQWPQIVNSARNYADYTEAADEYAVDPIRFIKNGKWQEFIQPVRVEVQTSGNNGRKESYIDSYARNMAALAAEAANDAEGDYINGSLARRQDRPGRAELRLIGDGL